MTEPYAQLLSTAPGSCAGIRKELEKIHGVKIAGSSYERVWDSLVGYFGADGAASVVGHRRDTKYPQKIDQDDGEA